MGNKVETILLRHSVNGVCQTYFAEFTKTTTPNGYPKYLDFFGSASTIKQAKKYVERYFPEPDYIVKIEARK